MILATNSSPTEIFSAVPFPRRSGQNFFATLVQMLNMIMVSRVGPEATAAVGLTNQPFMFALALFFALNVGTTAVVARSIGARDFNTANEAARQSFLINAALAVVFSLVGYVFAGNILLFMRAEPEVLPGGLVYFRIISATFGFSSLSMGLSAMLRGAGDTRTPMLINIVANAVVVVLGYPLIYGLGFIPALGVAGAGIASGAARFTGMAMALRALTTGNVPLRISLRDGFRLHWPVLERIVRVGFPSAMEQLIMRSGQLVFVRVVAGLGTQTMAAHQIALNVISLSFMPGMAFSIAATTLVGQSLGARRPDTAVAVGWEVRRLGTWLACGVGGVFIFGAPWIMRLYTTEASVIAQGALALRIIGLIQPFMITQFILAGALRGAGHTTWPLLATASGMWGVRVVLVYVLVSWLGFGLAGAWTAMALDQLFRSSMVLLRYRQTHKWVTVRV